jgi:hypothetical protein
MLNIFFVLTAMLALVVLSLIAACLSTQSTFAEAVHFLPMDIREMKGVSSRCLAYVVLGFAAFIVLSI